MSVPPKPNPTSRSSAAQPRASSPSSPTAPPTDLTVASKISKIPDGFPATYLVERCLKLIAATVSPIPRDVHTIGQVFTRANSVYEGILARIRQIEGSADTDVDIDWTPFDAYTIAIPKLERFLFDFSQGYAQEKPRGHLPPTDTTVNGILYINTWRTDRDLLVKSLENLKHDDFKLKDPSGELAKQLIAAYTKERQEDDRILLSALQKFLQETNKLGDEQIEKGTKTPLSVKTMKGELAGIMKKLFSAPYNHVATSIVVRTFMYFAIPCTLILSKKSEDQWKIYLRKTTIWDALNTLITQVKAYVNAPKGEDEIEKLFLEIERLLLNLGDTDIATALEMLSLFRLAPAMYRQYSGRSAALIKTLYYLDLHSRKPEQKAFASHRYDLKQVMTECADRLQALSKVTLEIANFSKESTDYQAKAKEIEGLFGKTKPLFQSLGADGQLARYEELYSQAVSTDEEHLIEAKQKLFPTPAAAPAGGS